jgi:hypothetical protein
MLPGLGVPSAMPELPLFIGMSPLEVVAGAQADKIKARLVTVKNKIFFIMVPL